MLAIIISIRPMESSKYLLELNAGLQIFIIGINICLERNVGSDALSPSYFILGRTISQPDCHFQFLHYVYDADLARGSYGNRFYSFALHNDKLLFDYATYICHLLGSLTS